LSNLTISFVLDIHVIEDPAAATGFGAVADPLPHKSNPKEPS
jgi:hypothetical protein